MKDSFSISRMWQYMKYDFMSNAKTNLVRIFAIYVTLSLLMILASLIISAQDDFMSDFSQSLDSLIVITAVMFSFTLVVSVGISFSYILEPMKTRGGRIVHLMIPATRGEKFVARAIYSTFGLMIAVIVALIAADLTRNLFLLAFGHKFYGVIGFIALDVISHAFTPLFSLDFVLWLWLIVNASLFIVGGALWYNYAFIKTIALQYAISFVALIVMVTLAIVVGPFVDLSNILEPIFNRVLVSIVLSVIVILEWWGAFRLYKKAQIEMPRFVFKRT